MTRSSSRCGMSLPVSDRVNTGSGEERPPIATSTDGIHWEKPILNLVEINGSKKNNYIFPEMLSLNYNII